MSRHFSKFNLNVWAGNPYFEANVPKNYPTSLVLMTSRAFRRLPPNLQRLASLSKQWATAHGAKDDSADWYDDQGYELDPDTGRRLTDTEIDAEWDALGVNPGIVMDIPVPEGGFPDPKTWEAPSVTTPRGKTVSRKQLAKDVASHGRKYTADYYGIPIDQLKQFDEYGEKTVGVATGELS